MYTAKGRGCGFFGLKTPPFLGPYLYSFAVLFSFIKKFCNLGFYRSVSASRIILVRSGSETFTGYYRICTQGKEFSPCRTGKYPVLSSISSECIQCWFIVGFIVLCRLYCTVGYVGRPLLPV
jgi:hypothetical protein